MGNVGNWTVCAPRGLLLLSSATRCHLELLAQCCHIFQFFEMPEINIFYCKILSLFNVDNDFKCVSYTIKTCLLQ